MTENVYHPAIHGVCGWPRPVVRPGDETVEAYRLGRGVCSCGLEVRIDFTGEWVHFVAAGSPPVDLGTTDLGVATITEGTVR